MTTQLLAIAGVLVVLLLVSLVVDKGRQWWTLMRRTRSAPPPDPTRQVDPWTDARRRGLTQLQQPSVKGFDAQQGDRRAHADALKGRQE